MDAAASLHQDSLLHDLGPRPIMGPPALDACTPAPVFEHVTCMAFSSIVRLTFELIGRPIVISSLLRAKLFVPTCMNWFVAG